MAKDLYWGYLVFGLKGALPSPNLGAAGVRLLLFTFFGAAFFSVVFLLGVFLVSFFFLPTGLPLDLSFLGPLYLPIKALIFRTSNSVFR